MKDSTRTLLRRALGQPAAEFRDGQWEAIETLVERRSRLLVVQRTGWGKSIVYFLATKLLRDRGAGWTLLVSPLLSLMRNQIAAARNIGIRAETINSTNPDDWQAIEQRLLAEQIDVLLISPERLANQDFMHRCLLPAAGRIGLFVIDEAHCISDWGHDFRPDYQRIVRILRALPAGVPVLATTATANDRVVNDVVQQLGANLEVLRGPLARPTLRLYNIRIPSAAARMAWLAQYLPRLPGAGIVYTLTVRDADLVAGWLKSRGIDAEAYHAQMDGLARECLENRLLANEVKALVATVALGMGFDKPDLGFVTHFQRPASVVHYYQQVGRAGRAVEKAYGILMSGAEDDEIADYFIRTAFPSPAEVEALLDALRRSPTPLSVGGIQRAVNLSRGKIDKILKFLQLESPSPVQKIDSAWALNPVRWQMPVERIERITQARRLEQERMRQYMASGECLMRFLARELSDPQAQDCGKCANCTGRQASSGLSEELVEAALQFLDRLENKIETRGQWPSGLTAPGMKGRIDPAYKAAEGRALCRWGDPGPGDLVRSGKQRSGQFDERLVQSACRMIRERWKPDPPPAWVTCVTSLRHLGLVPDFAQRLARELRLPFIDCIRKVRETAPQKSMQNSFQQCQNLAGAFEVDPRKVRPEPVLLVDDMADSRWTFTVLAALLRQAGSGEVYPLALADSSGQDNG